jgi:hypothetical protein
VWKESRSVKQQKSFCCPGKNHFTKFTTMKFTYKIKPAKTTARKPVVTKLKQPKARTTPGKSKVAKPVEKPRRQITTEKIAACAYILWEKAGRPPGRDVEYWLQAEAQLKQDSQSFSE